MISSKDFVKPDRDTLWRQIVKEKHTQQEVADYYNVAKSTISRLCKEYNIKRGSISRDDLYNLYIVENLNQRDIADLIGVTQTHISQLLSKYSIVKADSVINKNKMKSAESTNAKLYGGHPLSNPEVRQKISDTLYSRYGCRNPDLIGKPNTECLYSEDLLREAIDSLQVKTIWNLAEKLSLSYSAVQRALHKYNLFYAVEHPGRDFSSRYELEIFDFIRSLGFECYKTTLAGDVSKRYEIDIFVPAKMLGIEFNGNYFHSDLVHEKDYHFKKSEAAAKEGIFLYHIFEYEWNDPIKKEIIKSNILSLLGCSKKIYARKCFIKDVATSESAKFLQENHLQGYCVASVTYGLYYEDELVALMSFSKARFKSKAAWELIRFVSKRGYTVVGGASRLFKRFLVNHDGDIISFSDISHTRGTLYKSLGFTYVRNTSLNYVWYSNKTNTVLSRYKCQMKNEDAVMRSKGYCRIYGCGSKLWLYSRS